MYTFFELQSLKISRSQKYQEPSSTKLTNDWSFPISVNKGCGGEHRKELFSPFQLGTHNSLQQFSLSRVLYSSARSDCIWFVHHTSLTLTMLCVALLFSRCFTKIGTKLTNKDLLLQEWGPQKACSGQREATGLQTECSKAAQLHFRSKN